MIRKIIIFLVLTGIPASLLSDVEIPVSGKKGEGLAEVIRVYGRPKRLAESSELTFSMPDRFEGKDVSLIAGVLPEGYEASGLICPDWWREYDVYGDTISRDLANFYPISEDVKRHRADLPPGASVTTPHFETPLWSAGVARVWDVDTELYVPPVALLGRLARAYFYMAVMYPQGIMRPRAYSMFTGRPYPGLTSYALGLLLEWHQTYPVGEDEREMNELMERLQHNRNPFVDDPGLVDYLWGDKTGEVVEVEGKPVPLHSTYRPSDTIYFTTPSAPEDAVWSVDGRVVTAPSVPASAYSAGTHDVIFRSALTGESGYAMIKIEEK